MGYVCDHPSFVYIPHIYIYLHRYVAIQRTVCVRAGTHAAKERERATENQQQQQWRRRWRLQQQQQHTTQYSIQNEMKETRWRKSKLISYYCFILHCGFC